MIKTLSLPEGTNTYIIYIIINLYNLSNQIKKRKYNITTAHENSKQ